MSNYYPEFYATSQVPHHQTPAMANPWNTQPYSAQSGYQYSGQPSQAPTYSSSLPYATSPYPQNVNTGQMFAAQQPVQHPVAPAQTHRNLTRNDNCTLHIEQEPEESLITVDGREKSRKPVDPPPIISMHVNEQADPMKLYINSPNVFCATYLVGEKSETPIRLESGGPALIGTLVSSIHKLKSASNEGMEFQADGRYEYFSGPRDDGGYFVFGDISVKRLGTFRLCFTLFDIQKPETSNNMFAKYLARVYSKPFQVRSQKDYKGLMESTYLSRTFSDQGVRLRLRKEARSFTGNNNKRGIDDVDAVSPAGEQHQDLPLPVSTPMAAHYSQDRLDDGVVKRQRYDGGDGLTYGSSYTYPSDPYLPHSHTDYGGGSPPVQANSYYNSYLPSMHASNGHFLGTNPPVGQYQQTQVQPPRSEDNPHPDDVRPSVEVPPESLFPPGQYQYPPS